MLDIMTDLETFGVGYDGIIVQIGACYFDRNTGEIGEKFHMNIDATSSERYGFKFSADTVYWWMRQSKEAQATLLDKQVEIKLVLNEFNNFVSASANIWSHATFDFVLLWNHYQKVGIKPNFHWRQARDIRTLIDLSKINTDDIKREGIHHNAIDDCLYQVKYCVEAMKQLKNQGMK